MTHGHDAGRVSREPWSGLLRPCQVPASWDSSQRCCVHKLGPQFGFIKRCHQHLRIASARSPDSAAPPIFPFADVLGLDVGDIDVEPRSVRVLGKGRQGAARPPRRRGRLDRARLPAVSRAALSLQPHHARRPSRVIQMPQEVRHAEAGPADHGFAFSAGWLLKRLMPTRQCLASFHSETPIAPPASIGSRDMPALENWYMRAAENDLMLALIMHIQ